MTRPVHVAVLTQYFEPEIGAAQLRYSAFVRAVAALGVEVDVVTALPNHPTGAIFPEFRGRPLRRDREDFGVVYRSWVYPAVGSGLRRYVNFISFAVSSLFNLARLRRVDVLVVESPPVTVALVGWLAHHVLRCRLITYVSDLSSNSLEDLDVAGAGVVGRVIRAAEGFVYRSSDLVTTVTDGLVTAIADQYRVPADRIVMLANGADTAVFSPRTPDASVIASFGVGDRPYVLYAGTHGYAHGLDTAVDAARLLEPDGIDVLFVGEGSDRERIVESARGLPNVRFSGQQPPSVVAELYAGALCGISTVRDVPVMHDARPAKLFACLSCAKPIVYSGAGEGARLVERASAGVVTRPEDAAELADGIRWIRDHPDEAARMGERGRRFIEEHFGWASLVGAWAEAALGAGHRDGSIASSASPSGPA